MDFLSWQKKSIRLLIIFNAILLGLSWVMMIQAYFRLPEEIPYWLPLAGQPVFKAPKGSLFFLYPLFQTFFLLVFYLAGTVWINKPERAGTRPIPEPDKNSAGKISQNERTAAGEGRAEEAGAVSSGRPAGQTGDVESDDRRRLISKEAEASSRTGEISPGVKAAHINLKKELVWLLMVFFNLIFIHIQRSLIWLAYGLSVGVNRYYFFSLLVIILLLIPYYRFRLALLNRGHL